MRTAPPYPIPETIESSCTVATLMFTGAVGAAMGAGRRGAGREPLPEPDPDARAALAVVAAGRGAVPGARRGERGLGSGRSSISATARWTDSTGVLPAP